MTYRVWEGINKHENHWAVRKRRMTPISVHREKKGENHTQRRRGADERKNTPHGEEEEEEEEGGSTEMQQDQIRAFGLFILVNTTPRIYLKF